MVEITVTLSEEYYEKLRDMASRLAIPPEVLVSAGVEDFLSRPSEEFRGAVKYVLSKNAELYRRLA